MKAQKCEWGWMVEAGGDGRLSEEQRTEFARHAARCETCARQAASISRLGEVMAAIPYPAADDFHHRRQRQRLLLAAGERQMSISPAQRWWSGRRVAIAAVAVVVVVGGVTVRQIGRRPATVASGAPSYEVTDLEGASWTNQENGASARVNLASGSAAFHVHKLGPGQKFVVALPDCEIEVRGTRFVVNVEDGRTRHVVVMEGKVALRHRGAAEQLLLGGQRWDAPVPAEPTSAPPAAPALAPALAARPTVHVPARRPATVRRQQVAAVAVSPDVSAEPPSSAVERRVEAKTPPPAGADLFARGVEAFRAGRYDEADGLLRAFVAKHPKDPRVEDVAFLRAVGRVRLGDAQGAATLARDYLERFPHGMRRREAEAISRRSPQQPTETP